MFRLTKTVLLGMCLLWAGCRSAEVRAPEPGPKPPTARVAPKKLTLHGHERVDNYYWLNQREDPEVLAYLRAENEYADAVTQHTAQLQETLFHEIVSRIKQTDMSVPYKLDDYYYYTRYDEGEEYPVYCRRQGSPDAPEQVMLDVNALAVGHEYISVPEPRPSHNHDIIAFATDTQGRYTYTIRFMDLPSGQVLGDALPGAFPFFGMAWAKDNKTLYYVRKDPVTLRPYRVYRHVLGTDPDSDEPVYEEKDDTFGLGVFRTKSKRFLMIVSRQTLSTEIRYLNLDDPNGTFMVLQPRERNRLYTVEHHEDRFYILTNDDAENFRLMSAPITDPGREHWREVIPHRPDVLLEDFQLFRDHLVLVERKDGLQRIRIIPFSGEGEHYVAFDEPAYSVQLDRNPELDTQVLRFRYQSMTTPESVYDYDMTTREKVLRKRQEVLGGFDPADYATERLFATADDGSRVPISLLYRKGAQRDGRNPLLLLGYGSYGYSFDARFDSARLSLVDRGFIVAIAHVRGGQELGRRWYEDGKLLNKKNTFTDFIACAEHLVREKYTSPDRLYAAGGSAGGLLMGAVVNMRPDLFHAVVAQVPFVDVLTTMLDPNIPLTTSEYDEWGDPNVKEYYDYILSYSPYDNVQAKAYPHLLVMTSLSDSQVQYFEPAKWVAKLRALKTDGNRLILKTNMSGSHGGASGRFRHHRETAYVYAFLLDLAGLGE